MTLETDAPPDNKIHGANMEPTWVLSAPYGPHVGPMKLAIRAVLKALSCSKLPWQRNYSNRYMQMAYLQLHCDIPLQYICEYLTDIILG